MCGIAGIFGQGNIVTMPILEAMARRLAHRGPDDEGIEVLPVCNGHDISLGLVHRRLSIIDLSEAGHQPMRDEDTGNWIVYNGEIYNFPELRQALAATGQTFKSNSDTEVILKAYSAYGIACLEKLRGMFAFAIYDEKKKMLFLAVDRFGIKPLYYYQGGEGQFIFSSEIRAMLNCGLIEKRIEPLAVDSFLAYGAVQAPLTIIREIYSLLPAHYATYDFQTRKIETVQYWSPADNLSDDPMNNETEAIERLRDILQDCVKKHLISDVPVGLFLSGGIDSSSIVSLANTLNEGELQSFSVSFPESAFSEGKYSQLIAGKYCKNHTEIKLSAEDLLGLLPRALASMDQPTIDGINIYAISRVVREAGIKVVLSGQGGDEVFGGYSTFKRIPLISKLHSLAKIFPFSMRMVMGRIIDSLLKRQMIGSKVSQVLESDGDILSFCLILRQLFSPKARKYLIKENRENDLVNGVPLQVVDLFTSEMKQFEVFNTISLLELRLYLANMLLRDGDFMSMAHGIEVRVPFLDHELVEFVFNVSSKIKLQNNLPKSLLVKAMGDMLPEEIYMRPKMGFTFPWEIWLRNQLRSQVDDLIFGFSGRNETGLNMKNCRHLWQMFLRYKSGISWARVWAIYVLLYWCKENGVK